MPAGRAQTDDQPDQAKIFYSHPRRIPTSCDPCQACEKQGIPRHRVLAAENGKVVCFDDKGARIDGQVYTGRVLIDGKGIGDVGRSVLKERRNLSEDGLVVVSMIIDEETGIVLYGPELVSKGFVFALKPAIWWMMPNVSFLRSWKRWRWAVSPGWT